MLFTVGIVQMCTYVLHSLSATFHTTSEEFENGGFTLKTHQMFSVHTTPEEFENEGFTLKTHQMFSVHTTPHSRPQRPRSFWSAPRIATSGQVQQRKSAIHGLPVTLRML